MDYQADYIAAYCAYNPDKRAPEFAQQGSWVVLTTWDANGVAYKSKYQRSRIIEMTATLRARVAADNAGG